MSDLREILSNECWVEINFNSISCQRSSLHRAVRHNLIRLYGKARLRSLCTGRPARRPNPFFSACFFFFLWCWRFYVWHRLPSTTNKNRELWLYGRWNTKRVSQHEVWRVLRARRDRNRTLKSRLSNRVNISTISEQKDTQQRVRTWNMESGTRKGSNTKVEQEKGQRKNYLWILKWAWYNNNDQSKESMVIRTWPNMESGTWKGSISIQNK